MIEHWCGGRWQPGAVLECALGHVRRGRAPNLTPFAGRTHTVTEGVASTGQVSSKGTVAHREHFDGRVDATVNPRPVSVSLFKTKEDR